MAKQTNITGWPCPTDFPAGKWKKAILDHDRQLRKTTQASDTSTIRIGKAGAQLDVQVCWTRSKDETSCSVRGISKVKDEDEDKDGNNADTPDAGA